MTFAEFLKYGTAYARDVTVNAFTLAERLSELGEKVVGENMGYTKSHQSRSTSPSMVMAALWRKNSNR